MKKKIVIIISSIVLLFTFALSPLALTVTSKLPDNMSSVPILYYSLRAYDGRNNLCWLNLNDQRIARNTSADNLAYQENSDIWLPNDTYPMYVQHSTNITNDYATMRFKVLEKVHKLNFFSPEAYIYFSLEDLGVSVGDHQKRQLYITVDGYSGGNIIRYADLRYDMVSVNNVTGQIIEQRAQQTITPSWQYYEGLGYYNMIKVDFTPINSNHDVYYKNIDLKVYYEGDIQQISISSPKMLITQRNLETQTALLNIGKVNGSFSETEIPSDWFGWIIGGVDGFMSIELLPNLSLWTIFYGIFGLILAMLIMRKFAGG